MHDVKVFPIILIVLVCVGCGSGNPAPGTWEGTSSLGDFSFEVDDSGENILSLTYEFTCQSGGVTTTSSGTIDFVTPLEISGGIFERDLSDIVWEGTFSGSDAASGTLTFLECDSGWEAASEE